MKSIALLVVLTTTIPRTLAWWKQVCEFPIVVERADPIVSPGNRSAHVHTVTGGSAFGLSLAPGEMAASMCTSCQIMEDLSAYWVPQLYFHTDRGRFISVSQVGGLTVYIQQRNNSGEKIYAFPDDFRMVAGNPFLRTFSNSLEQRAITYTCLNHSNSAISKTFHFPPHNCPGGLLTEVAFPQCWNGKLDSPDHKSHMAYPEGINHGRCPSTHPMRVLFLYYEIIWKTNDFAANWYGKEQPFVWAMGDPTGYGLHGDFFTGWDFGALEAAIHQCHDPSGDPRKCHVYNLQDEIDCSLERPPIKDEKVLGNLTKLPGCNPVTWNESKTPPKC